MNEPTFDVDGYPTDETLEAIKKWPYQDFLGLIQFIAKAWSYPDRVVHLGQQQIGSFAYDNVWYLSTGGWSGNESIIGAMQENRVFWMCCWLRSTRGGHYEFNVRTK